MYIKRFVLWGFWFLIFYEQGMYDCTCAVMYNIGSFGAGYVLYMHFHLVSVELVMYMHGADCLHNVQVFCIYVRRGFYITFVVTDSLRT